VYRARAAVFAELTWLILISAWEFKSIRRSLFRLQPDDESSFPLFKDLMNNKFLFWAVLIGALSVFPTVYIPVLNTKVFKHTTISWEWGLVVGMTIVFLFGMEAWKWTKRTLNILDDHKVVRGAWSQGEEGSNGRKFGKSMSFSSLRSWRSRDRTDTKSRSQQNPNTTQLPMLQGISSEKATGNSGNSSPA